jgi:hypothetical protein
VDDERDGGDVAELVKGRRITGSERGSLSAELRRRYEGGSSIRALAADTGRSYGFVHRVLLESGATLRGRGGATRGKR